MPFPLNPCPFTTNSCASLPGAWLKLSPWHEVSNENSDDPPNGVPPCLRDAFVLPAGQGHTGVAHTIDVRDETLQFWERICRPPVPANEALYGNDASNPAPENVTRTPPDALPTVGWKERTPALNATWW